MEQRPFRPSGPPVEIDVSASSQRVLVATGKAERQVRICNEGTATVWITSGDATVTVTATAGQSNTGIRIPAGAIEVLTFQSDTGPLYLAAIAAAATGKIEFTPGGGV